MTDEQHELAVFIKDRIEEVLKRAVDTALLGQDPEVEELVRTLLTEQMRFWRDH